MSKEIPHFLYISGTGWHRIGQHFHTLHEIVPYPPWMRIAWNVTFLAGPSFEETRKVVARSFPSYPETSSTIMWVSMVVYMYVCAYDTLPNLTNSYRIWPLCHNCCYYFDDSFPHASLQPTYALFFVSASVPRHSAGINCGCTSSKAHVVKQHMDQPGGGALLAVLHDAGVRVWSNERA